MDRRSGAAVAEIDLAGFCFQQRHQLRHRMNRQFRIDHQHQRRAEDQRHRLQVLERVVGQRLDQRRIGGKRARRGQQRLSVRRCLDDVARGQDATGAGAILDDDRFAELLLEPSRHRPHDDVDAAARRERHDEGDRSGRKFGGARRKARCHARAPENSQQMTPCRHFLRLDLRHRSRTAIFSA